MKNHAAGLGVLVLAAFLAGTEARAQNMYQSDSSSRLKISSRRFDQSGSGNSGYQQGAAKATPTPAAANRATAAKTPTRSSTRGSSGTQTARPSQPKPGAPSKPGGAPGATTTGQIKEVTKGLLDSVRTRRVNFDSEAMAKKPGVVILNPRKLQPQQSRLERESAKTAPAESIARPL